MNILYLFNYFIILSGAVSGLAFFFVLIGLSSKKTNKYRRALYEICEKGKRNE